MELNKRQQNKLKKLLKASLDTQGDEAELNKLAIELVKLGFLDEETAADDQGSHDAALQRFQRMKLLKKELAADAARIARGNLEARARDLFEKHPELESFGWRQSTPTETQEYGYDGFMRVHAETPFINGVEQDWKSPRDEDGAAGSVRRTLAFLFWRTELQDMFGDGTEITIKRDGTIETQGWWPPDD